MDGSWLDLLRLDSCGDFMMETIEQFLARGGQIKVLDTKDRALHCPNREFSIVSAGARERKQYEEGRRV